MNAILKIMIFVVSLITIHGCSPNFEGDDANRAEVLIRTNVMCSIFVKYRIGQVTLLALNGEKHSEIASDLAAHTEMKSTSDFERRLTDAFRQDLEGIFSQPGREAYEIRVAEMYQSAQDDLEEKYGYSYPDCDIALAMGQELLERKSYF